MDLILFLKNEWTIVSGAPFVFLSGGVIFFGLGYYAARWAYQSRIDTKYCQISDYKERLGYLPPRGEFQKLTNAELKKEMQNFVQKLRTCISNQKIEERKIFQNGADKFSLANREEQDKIFKHNRELSNRALDAFELKYKKEYKIKARSLKDEAITRLNINDRDVCIDTFYESQSCCRFAERIADDLEQLAISLA